MKNLIPIILLSICYTFNGSAQLNLSPRNINSALTRLDKECSDSLKNHIQNTTDDSLIYLTYPWGSGELKVVYNWTERKNSRRKTRLGKYYAKKGISYNSHIQQIILLSFKTVLDGHTLKHDEIILPFKLKEEKWALEDKGRYTTDSMRGVYIPVDLEDCFGQIDGFWSDSTKINVAGWSEDEFVAHLHHGFGTWMRNNWQLWGGSRLSKYFNGMGIYHPDDMSGIVLRSYHRFLVQKDINLEEQIKHYQDYWEEVKEKKD